MLVHTWQYRILLKCLYEKNVYILCKDPAVSGLYIFVCEFFVCVKLFSGDANYELLWMRENQLNLHFLSLLFVSSCISIFYAAFIMVGHTEYRFFILCVHLYRIPVNLWWSFIQVLYAPKSWTQTLQTLYTIRHIKKLLYN